MEKELIKYETMTGQEIQLSPDIIRQYLISGDSTKITDQEVMMFLSLCRYQRLNPFIREAYIIKYGNTPATIVTGKETFLKRAVKNPKYRGHRTGIDENTKAAWAEVYVEGYDVPIRCEVDYKEYVGLKSDGTPNRMWATKPKTMLKKVALVQALREAFPDDFGGMYSPEEINTIDQALPADTVQIQHSPDEKTKDTLKDPEKKHIPETEEKSRLDYILQCNKQNEPATKAILNSHKVLALTQKELEKNLNALSDTKWLKLINNLEEGLAKKESAENL